jgi:hypothetical protein
LLYLCGALTEMTEAADLLHCRLADPTGAFDIVAGTRNAALADQIRSLPVPSFIAVTGTARLFHRNGTNEISVRPGFVGVSDRTARDRWVVSTAGMTLARLETLLDALEGNSRDPCAATAVRHYRITREHIAEIARMVEDALAGIHPVPDQAPARAPADISGIIMEMIREKSSPRGVSVDEIVAGAGEQGYGSDAVLAAIRVLVENDDCYQPQKGYVKPL